MGGERQTKRSCPFCQHEERDVFEQNIIDGIATAQVLDKDMGWRANTAERHMKNHTGTYHEGANHSCVVCTHDDRRFLEVAYFEGERTTDDIAEELDCSEEAVYRHMKHHFQPMVQRAAVAEVVMTVGQETDTLRSNVELLNHKLSELLNEGSVHEDGFVRDAVALHKEVRESIKDLVKLQENWGPTTENNEIHNTINILKVELGKESPESWARIREKLMDHVEEEIV